MNTTVPYKKHRQEELEISIEEFCSNKKSEEELEKTVCSTSKLCDLLKKLVFILLFIKVASDIHRYLKPLQWRFRCNQTNLIIYDYWFAEQYVGDHYLIGPKKVLFHLKSPKEIFNLDYMRVLARSNQIEKLDSVHYAPHGVKIVILELEHDIDCIPPYKEPQDMVLNLFDNHGPVENTVIESILHWIRVILEK